MARRGRRGGYRRRVGSWFRRGAKNPRKKYSLMNIMAGLLSVLGIGIPILKEAHLRYIQPGNTFWDALTGAGDMLSIMFLGRDMSGTATHSPYKYMGWWVIGGSAGILAVNKLVRMFAGRVPIWGRWVVN